MSDYIIVGAGSAGCVLANRLSADPHVTVLVLEAGGPDKRQEVRMPAAFPKLFQSAVDWAYYTEEEPHMHNRILYWPRGKMLGGSSAMNAMIYMRGHRANYDGWEHLGNEGWNYEAVLLYFKKAENNARLTSPYHGRSGPLLVSDLRTINPLSQAFVTAATEVGIRPNDDFNGAEQEGIGLYQVTQNRGKRWSAADAYLRPAMPRPNLTVQTGAQVTRVRFEKQRAIGVEYWQHGQKHQAHAHREVLLSGGAINSPQLLMLSGIGPADHLRPLGIEVVVDLPGVGRNLQDHLVIAITYACKQPVSLANAERLRHLLHFLVCAKGPLTSNISEAGGFVKTRADVPIPDVQLHFTPVFFMEHGFANPPGHGFTIGPTLLYPHSCGRITLRSRDPYAAPALQPHYLEHASDMRVLLEGVNVARHIAHANALTPYRGAEVWPGAQAQDERSLADFIRAKAQTLYHPVGTCKMGTDVMAVVDAQLHVHGVEGLRVVDASIMPMIVGGNTHAPTIMIAEKAAALMMPDKQ